MKSLEGKIALITGGSRGIGAEIARQFATAGANVAITCSQSVDRAEQLVRELQASGSRAKAFQADAMELDKLPAMVEAVAKEFGGLDILVNCAGVFGGGKIGTIALEHYRRAMTVNVDAVFVTTQAVLQHMPDGGRIINIGSVLGERATAPGMSPYNASKAAVAMLTRSWAKDLGERNILVNAIQPGPIDTEMNPADGDKADFMRSMTALGRYGKPEEIAALALFLAGPGATYITGATLNVDGGWNA